MPLFAQRLVSKKKRRLVRDDFDLDLSYIWPAPDDPDDGLPPDGQPARLITMGFPCENGAAPTDACYTMSQQEVSAHHLAGLDPGDGKRTARMGGTSVDGWFRNPMDQVQGFLETYHANHYKVFNFCSERWYDHGNFHGRVSRYPFADHNCPSPAMIHACCADAAAWLSADPENVVAFHCKAGKGRAGMMTTCLLLHMGWCATAREALDHYAHNRTHNGQGVTIPSQIRYVEYYATLLERQRTQLAAEGAPAPRPGMSLSLPLTPATIRLRAVGMGPFMGYGTYVRDRWGAGGEEGSPTVRAERLGGDVWDSSEAWGSAVDYELQPGVAGWGMTGPASGAVLRGDACISLHPWGGSPTAKCPKQKAAFWLNTGMVAAQCEGREESSDFELGCTTAERVGEGGSTYRVALGQLGLDKAQKKDWGKDEAFVIWLEFEILADAAEHTLCWDEDEAAAAAVAAEEAAPKEGRTKPTRGGGGGMFCCAAPPRDPDMVVSRGERPRAGGRPGMGKPSASEWIEAAELEPEPEPEPALTLSPVVS